MTQESRAQRVVSLVNRLDMGRGIHILDLGRGAGPSAVELSRRGYRVAGCEVVESLFASARATLVQEVPEIEVDLRLSGGEDLAHGDKEFELVVAENFLEHCQWVRWALQEMHRVLKPGGHLVVSRPRIGKLNSLLLFVRERLFGAVFSGWRTPSPSLGKRRFLRTIKDLGFEVLSERPLHGRRTTMVCRKRAETGHGEHSWFLGDLEERLRRFHSDWRTEIRRLDKWKRKHPQLAVGPLQNFDATEYSGCSVLVLSPHPDDELVGCGGSMLKLLEAGARITVLQMTDGSDSVVLRGQPDDIRRTIRIREAQEVAAALGVELLLWKEPDGQLQNVPANAKRLLGLLATRRPAAVFLPFQNEAHRDHGVTNRILGEALRKGGDDLSTLHLFCYEVWSLLPANTVSNIDAEFDAKARLLLDYRTAMKGNDYVAVSRYLNAYRATSLTQRAGFSEAFFQLSVARFLGLHEHTT